MSLLERLLGAKPAAKPIDRVAELQGLLGDTQLKLESAEADLAEANEKLLTVEVRGNLEKLEDFTELKRAAELSIIVSTTQIVELEKALEKAEHAALIEDLEKRSAEAMNYANKGYLKDVREYERERAVIDKKADAIIAREQNHAQVNAERKALGLPALPDLSTLHGEPEKVLEKEREVVTHEWFVKNHHGLESGACIYNADGRPQDASAYQRPVVRKIPAKVQPAKGFATMSARRAHGLA